MRGSADRTRSRILDAAYDLFYEQGFTRVSIDAVAHKAGLTKRTLYSHFESKDELLGAVLQVQHALALERLHDWTVKVPSSSSDVIEALFDELAAWAQRPRWSGAGFTRLALELADLPGHPARVMARRHKSAIEQWLAGVLAASRTPHPAILARQILLLAEGSMALMVVHGDRAYIDEAAAAARLLADRAAASP